MPSRRSRSLSGSRLLQTRAVEKLAVTHFVLHVCHDALPQCDHPGQVVRVCLVYDTKDALPACVRHALSSPLFATLASHSRVRSRDDELPLLDFEVHAGERRAPEREQPSRCDGEEEVGAAGVGDECVPAARSVKNVVNVQGRSARAFDPLDAVGGAAEGEEVRVERWHCPSERPRRSLRSWCARSSRSRTWRIFLVRRRHRRANANAKLFKGTADLLPHWGALTSSLWG